jgi:hypothetical protein
VVRARMFGPALAGERECQRTEPAQLIAVFVVDTDERTLTTPD